MTGILGEIVAHKKELLKRRKKIVPLRELEDRASTTGARRDFTGALTGAGCSLIAEIKTASPSKGIIRDDVDIADVAVIYSDNGASCISVLTDEKYFHGSLDRLTRVRAVTGLPLLRKDFIIDTYQLYEARDAGADAVLLIASCLGGSELKDFLEVAALLDLDCLVEVHDESEMERVASLDVRLIGINNRDLRTFETDRAVTGRLAARVPEGAVLVSESGIHSARDVQEVHHMGANAVLVGEAIMREKDMAGKVRELAEAVK